MDETLREWHLLSMVVPPFLALAKFFTGDNPTAVAARAEIDHNERGREPFYANLCVELQSLADHIETWDNELTIPSNAVAGVLGVLENRCSIATRSNVSLAAMQWKNNAERYCNLRKLQQEIHDSREKSIELSLDDLRGKIRLKERKKSRREQIIKRLGDCNRELERLARDTRPLETVSSVPFGEPQKMKILPLHQRRRLSNLVHQVLTKHWQCKCQTHHAEAKLLLETYSGSKSLSDGKFDVWLRTNTNSPSNLKWQECDIYASTTDEDQGGSNPQTKNSRGKSVKLYAPSNKNAPEASSRGGPWEVQKIGVCKLIQDAAKLSSQRLQFLVDSSKMYYRHPNQARHDSIHQEFLSLDHVIVESQPDSTSLLRKEKPLRRYILAFILANAFLQLSDGPWSPQHWNKQQIYFRLKRIDRRLDINEPYLLTSLLPWNLSNINEDEELRFRNRVHPYPNILALGIMLLQIWLGEPIESKRSSDNPNNKKDASLHNIDADLSVAQRMLEKCHGDSLYPYNNSIKACLAKDTFPLGASFEDQSFQQQLYAKIVHPIEQTLLVGYGVNVREEPILSSISLPDPEIQLACDQQLHHTRIEVQTRRQLELSLSKHPFLLPQHSDPFKGKGKLTEEKMHADVWFDDLARYVHPLLQKTPDETCRAIKNKVLERTGRVRIAILDTGIDLPEHIRWIPSNEHRIKDQKNWVRSRGGEDEMEDLDGHGTHATALLLKVAPEAEIYVARVFEKQREGTASTQDINNGIAAAIRYAVDQWKVDIITMSFGFKDSVPDIAAAIDHAYQMKVIMLAAAASSGGNEEVAWPARLSEVICIHATDGLGNKSSFTPNILPHSDNFSILGTDVMSSWPIHLGQGHECRKSGTSCATPIAAGIAAIVLEYAGLYLSRQEGTISAQDEQQFRKVRSVPGMRSVFRQMAKKRDGYDYIKPWRLLSTGPRGYKTSTAMDLILVCLKGET